MNKIEAKRGSTQWYVEMSRKIESNMLKIKWDVITRDHTRVENINRMFRMRAMINRLPLFEAAGTAIKALNKK